MICFNVADTTREDRFRSTVQTLLWKTNILLRGMSSGCRTHKAQRAEELFLNVSRPTIYKRIEAGELHPIKLGKRTIRIPIHELLSSTEMETVEKIGDFSIAIKLDEALLRYNTNRTDFYKTIVEHNIATKKRRRVAYYLQKTSV